MSLPLPIERLQTGSLPQDNRRPLRIPGKLDGLTLGQALLALFPHVRLEEWHSLCAQGLILTPKGRVADLEASVRSGEQYTRITRGVVEPGVAIDIRLLYEDDALVVVDKPAPLPVHPCGRYDRNTLTSFLRQLWPKEMLRPCHRLDANTTGVMVWAKDKASAGRVQEQFASGAVDKIYQARVHGLIPVDQQILEFPLQTPKGPSGLRDVARGGVGLGCRTLLRVVERGCDGTTTVELVPETGRTNQLRVHLWYSGHPIVGDPGYLTGGLRSPKLTVELGEPPMLLHCRELSFVHPQTGDRVEFCAPVPWK